MFKLIPSSVNSNELSVGFDERNARCKLKNTGSRQAPQKRIFHARVHLNEVSGYVEHQENAAYGLGYKPELNKKVIRMY